MRIENKSKLTVNYLISDETLQKDADQSHQSVLHVLVLNMEEHNMLEFYFYQFLVENRDQLQEKTANIRISIAYSKENVR